MNREKLKIEISLLLEEARSHELKEELQQCWAKLSEAHILSQPDLWTHVQVHWFMLKVGVRQSDWPEIIGQLLRLIVAAPGSLLGKYPVGNTGRSNVNMFLPMPVPIDIQKKIEHLKK